MKVQTSAESAEHWPQHHRFGDLSPTERRWAGVFAGIAVLGGVIAVLAIHESGQVLFGDEARLTLEALRAPRARPLLGVLTTASEYTGTNVHNPGPIQLYTLYPFVRVLGIDLGTSLYTALVIVGSALIAGTAGFRTGGRRAGLAVLVGAIAMLATTNRSAFAQVLNDPVVLMPMFACFVLAWALTAGDVLALPVLAVLASYCAQTYVGSALPILATSGVAVVVVLVRSRRWGLPTQAGQSLGVTAALATLMWLPPVIDQFTGSGNLGSIASLRIPGRGMDGAGAAIQAVFTPDRLAGGLIGSSQVLGPVSLVAWIWVVLGLTLVAVSIAALWTSTSLRGLAMVAGALLASAVLMGFLDPPSDQATYHFMWIGATSWFLLVTTTIAFATRRPRGGANGSGPVTRRTAVLASVTLIALMTSLVVNSSADGWRSSRSEMVEVLTEQLDRRLAPESRWRAATLKGFTAGDAMRGVEAHLIETNRSIDWGLSPDPLADGSLLFVHRTSPITVPGRRVASWAGDVDQFAAKALVPERVRRFASAYPHIELTPTGRNRIVNMVDGLAPSACVERLRADPDRLLSLDPGILASLYGQDDVSSPALPPDLRRDVSTWFNSAPVDVYRLDEPHLKAGFDTDTLILSTSDC